MFFVENVVRDPAATGNPNSAIAKISYFTETGKLGVFRRRIFSMPPRQITRRNLNSTGAVITGVSDLFELGEFGRVNQNEPKSFAPVAEVWITRSPPTLIRKKYACSSTRGAFYFFHI